MATRQRIVKRVVGGLLLGAMAVAMPWHPGAAEGAASKQLVQILVSDREQTACKSGHRDFVLEDLRDLHVCMVFPGLDGTHYAQLTFQSPDGNVYQTMTVAFVTPEAPFTKPAVSLSGRQYKVTRAGWHSRGAPGVIAILPVAGTHIALHNLVGRWTVKVSLNGQPVDWGEFYLHPRW